VFAAGQAYCYLAKQHAPQQIVSALIPTQTNQFRQCCSAFLVRCKDKTTKKKTTKREKKRRKKKKGKKKRTKTEKKKNKKKRKKRKKKKEAAQTVC